MLGRVLFRLARMLRAPENLLTGAVDTGPILQVFDPTQGGASIAKCVFPKYIVPGGQFSNENLGDVVLAHSIENDEQADEMFGDSVQMAVTALSYVVLGAGATPVISFWLQSLNSNPGAGRVLMHKDYGNNPEKSWQLIGGGAEKWTVPVGMKLVVDHGATAAGQSIEISVAITATPVGFAYLNP